MSKRVTIYRMAYPAAEPQGAVSVVAVGDGLEYHGEWMQHGYVTVTVNSATEIAFAVGDFVEFAGRKFYLWDEESVKKQARSGSYGEAYVYDNIKLHEGTVALEQVSMHDVVLEDNGQTYSSLSRFSFFGATVDDLADRIQANIVRQSTAIGGDTLRFRLFTPDKTRTTGRMSNMGNVGTAWESYYTGNEATGKKDVAVSIQNETLWGALGHAYNDFKLPYYVASSNENDVDYIDIVIGGKAVEVSNSAFVYGKGHGLYEIERSADSDQRIVTKLFAYGSTENLPTNYYGNLYKVAYADCLQSDTLVIDGGNYYFVDAVTGSGILWSSVKDALGVRADVRPSPFSIGGHTPVGKSVTVRCNNTNYTASIWVYETGGEQYLSFKTETQAPVVSDTKFYILDGVDLLKWPNSKIETASGYPGGMAIMNLMLPGFPKQSLKEMVEYEKSHPSGNRPAWMDRAYNFTTGQYNYVLSNDPADPWIQSANAAVYGVREGEVYFDGTDDRENIRPSIENTDFGTVASVTGITDDGWVDKTDGFVIKVLAANGGGDFWQAVWNAPHDDEVPLTMTSGYHNGREFKLTKVVVGTTYVELSVDRIQDESGRWVPNTEQPIVGRDLPTPQHDTFVVTGIQLPKEYIDAASEKLLMAAFDELDKIDHGLRTYQPRLDEIYMANEQATADIESRASLHDTLRAGMVLKWQWEDYGTQGATVISSTIDVLTIKEDGNNGVPTYDVVLRDEKEKSLTEKIATVVSKTAGIGGGTAVRSDGGNAETAKKADRLSGDDEVTAWGQTYWQDGRPQDVSGSLDGVDDITMTGDLNLGNTGMGIDQSGDAVLNSVTIAETTTTTSGGTETTTEDKAVLTEDGLVVTEKVDNTVTKSTVVDENGMTIGTYAEGLFGTGGVFKMIDGKSHLEADTLYVRMKAYFDTLEIRRYIHSGGNRVASAAGVKLLNVAGFVWQTILGVKTARPAHDGETADFYRCLFRASDGDNEITNDFEVGDLAYCHTTNLAGSGQDTELNQKLYWRLVIDKGSIMTDGVATEHYIDLSNAGSERVTIDEQSVTVAGYMTGSDEPSAEDDVVQLGNVNDPTRQGAIVEAVSGAGCAPTYRIYQGLGADSSNLYTFTSPKVDMGYDMGNAKAYLNVFGNFYVGEEGNNPNTYVRYTQGDGTQQNPPLLEIKAKIDASSPYGETSETIGDMFTNLNDGLHNAEDEITDLDYLKIALNEITTVEGGLILTNLIQLRQNNTVWAGISGQYSKDIAAWFGGTQKDYEKLTDTQKSQGWNVQKWAKSLFRFDGSGYLAGGNISWENDGDTTVQGTIKADNFFHAVCFFLEGGTYRNNVLCFYRWDASHDETYAPFHDGQYYTPEEIDRLSDHHLHAYSPGFTATTGTADVVMCMPRASNWAGNPLVTLPLPEDFRGKIVEVSAFSYTTGERTIGVTCCAATPRMVGLVNLDEDGRVVSNAPAASAIIHTGGVARFLSVERENYNGQQKQWVWTLLANQTGGDVIINGGGSGGGSVTSVGMSVPQGFSVTGSPITESGIFTIGFADGYALPTTADVNKGVTAYESLADYLTRQEALDTFVLTSALAGYVTIGTEQTISGLKTFSSNVQLGAGTAVKAYDKGTDLLAYKSGTWGGVTGEHWFVGAAGVNGFIRSASPLKRWANNSDQYTIWDASNFTPSALKVKDVQVVADNGLVFNGEDVIYDAVLASNGMLTLKSTRLSIAVPEYTSDLVNDSGFIDQTGGTIESLTVTNDLDADSITVGSIVNSNTLAEYLDSDAMQTWLQQQGYITQTTADGRYIKGVSVYGSSLTPDANRVVNIPYADINTPGVIQIGSGLLNSEGHTEVDTSVIASRSWANGQFVTALGVSGGNLTYTKNGASTPITVPFATRTMGFKRLNVTGSQIADANTRTVDGVTYALLSNYASTDLWANMPSGMSWGNVLQLASATSLDGQLAWDSNHGVTTGVTRKLYWRSRNSTGWGTNDWHTIAFEDWVTTQINNLGDNLQSYVTTQLGGYLPLTAGSSKPLTGSLYVTPGADTHQTVEIRGSQYYIGLAIGSGNVNRGLYGQTIGGSGSWLLYFDASNTILNYGNVGIGTTTPAAKLDVNGMAKANYILFKKYNDTNNAGYCGRGNGSNNNIYLMSYADNLCLGANSSTKDIYINTSHNVGIGTNQPNYKLDVNDVVRSTVGFVVRPANSDYVGLNNTGMTYCGASASSAVQLMDFGYNSSTNVATVKFPVRPQVKLNNIYTDVALLNDINTAIDNFAKTVATTYATKTQLGDYLQLSGGIVTGNLAFNGSDRIVYFGETNSYRDCISYYKDDSNNETVYFGYGMRNVGATQIHGLEVALFTNNLQRMKINSAGYIGIGTAPTTGYAVDVDGSVRASSFVNGSDARMKDIVEFIEPSVHDIAIAPIIEFKWKKGDGSKNIGSIAQYWQTVFPQAVHEGSDGMLSIEYANIALASAITAARHSLDNERRIAELELRVAELEDELAAMASQHSETTDN